jgi:hypothetical protein
MLEWIFASIPVALMPFGVPWSVSGRSGSLPEYLE